MKKVYTKPEAHKKTSMATKNYFETPGAKLKKRLEMLSVWARPEEHAKRCASMRQAYVKDPTLVSRQSRATLERYLDPEERRRTGEATAIWQSLRTFEARSASAFKTWETRRSNTAKKGLK